MAKRSLVEQLNQTVETMLLRSDSRLPVEPELKDLMGIAANLCDLPREEFKTELKDKIIRRIAMMTETPAVKTRPRTIPEGWQGATPQICIKDAARAIEFYKKAFGAKETMRLSEPGGRVGHAEMKIGDAYIMLADEYPEYGVTSAQTMGGSPISLHLYVDDVDAFVSKAVAAGAILHRPVRDEFYGDRTGSLLDPFGYSWNIATHKEDVTAEEMQSRFEQILAQPEESEVPEKKKPAHPIPEGYRTVTPYIMVQGAAQLIDFVQKAFGAIETFRTTGSAGGLHAEVRIGDSMMMMGGSPGMSFPEMPTAIHLYVNDVDAVFQRAIEVGGKPIAEPSDQDYGERVGGILDPFGNQWYIATLAKGATHVPKDHHTLAAYLHPHRSGKVIDFLKKTLGAVEVYRAESPDGIIHHAQVRIGDSYIEMGDAHGPYQPMPTAFYLYVPDVDALYDRAVRAGAISEQQPKDQPYGDRSAHVKDPFGNSWYIATHVRDVSS